MLFQRNFLPAVVACIGLAIAPGVASATNCGQPDGIPKFTATIDQSAAPVPPSEPYSLPGLDLYRTKLEIFRDNTVEGYNRKLIAYVNMLVRLDSKLRNAMSKGACTADEYEALNGQLTEELEKAKSEYLQPYNDNMTVYRRYMEWCKHEIARIRIALSPLGMTVAGMLPSVMPPDR